MEKNEYNGYTSKGEYYMSMFLQISDTNRILGEILNFLDLTRISTLTKGLNNEVKTYCDFTKWVENYGIKVDKKYARYVFFGCYNYEKKLKDYQRDVVNSMGLWKEEEIEGLKGGIINMKMRMGKTITSLTYILKNYRGQPSLVICKKSDIDTWETEIKKFFKDTIKYCVLDSSKKIRIKELDDKQIVLATYGYVRNVFKNSGIPCLEIKKCNFSKESEQGLFKLDEKQKGNIIVNIHKNTKLKCGKINLLYTRKWENIICDECNNISTCNTLTFKAVSVLYANAYFGLTGTLIYNKMLELYCIYKFMGLQINFKDMRKYENLPLKEKYNTDMFQIPLYTSHGLRKDPLKELIYKCNEKRICRISYKEAGVTVPDIEQEYVQLSFISDEKKLYDFYKNKFFEHYDRYRNKEEKFDNILVIMTRLRQICLNPHSIILNGIDKDLNGELLEYVKDKERSFLNSTKMKYCLMLVASILKENKNNKILVFSSFSNVLEDLCPLVKNSKIINGKVSNTNRIICKDLFMNDNKTKVLFLSYKTSAFGLNLSRATHVILLEPAWNNATEYQAIARSFVMGQEENKKVISLIMDNSIEYYMLKLQQEKEKLTNDDEFFDEFKGKKQSSTAKMLANMLVCYNTF